VAAFAAAAVVGCGGLAALHCEMREGSDIVEDDEETSAKERRVVKAAVVAGGWPQVEAWIQRHGADASLTLSGQSALSVAAEQGALYMVRGLLAADANPNSHDNQGLSVLIYAARQGHALVVQELLKIRASPHGPPDIFGNAPIHAAVGFGHTRVARALLIARCDADQRTGDVLAPESYGAQTLHEAPLHLACRAKPPHLELKSRTLVLLLLRFGANPCVQDDRGDTPVHHLVRKGDVSTLWALLSRTTPELADAAANGVRNARGATAIDEASAADAPTAVFAALRFAPCAAKWRQRLRLGIEEPDNDAGIDGAAEEATWKTYRERLDSGPALLPFEEGGDGVRRRSV